MVGLDMLANAGPLFQGGMGIFQSILAGMNKPQRPVYQVPNSVKQSTNIAENLASGDMPGFSTLQGMIDTQSGQALNTIKQGSPNSSGAVADILGKTLDAKNKATMANAEFKTNAAGNLQNALGIQGQYEDKGQQYNNIQNYEEKANASSALTGAGIHNMFSGLKDLTGYFATKGLGETTPESTPNFETGTTNTTLAPKVGETESEAIARKKLEDSKKIKTGTSTINGTFVDPNMVNKGYSPMNLLNLFPR